MRSLFLYVMLLAPVWTSGCASTEEELRARVDADHPEWNEADRATIAKKATSFGMNEEQVIYVLHNCYSLRKFVTLKDEGVLRIISLDFEMKAGSGAGWTHCKWSFDRERDVLVQVAISGGEGWRFAPYRPSHNGWGRLRPLFPDLSDEQYSQLQTEKPWVGMPERVFLWWSRVNGRGIDYRTSESPEVIVYVNDNFDTFTFDLKSRRLLTWVIHN